MQVGKRKVGKHSLAFRKQAVERIQCCTNVKQLAAELDVHRSVLYRWRDQLAPQDRPEWQAEQGNESMLERENCALKQALADKTLEADFFKGALQKVAARRQSKTKPGGTASTTGSGS